MENFNAVYLFTILFTTYKIECLKIKTAHIHLFLQVKLEFWFRSETKSR